MNKVKPRLTSTYTYVTMSVPRELYDFVYGELLAYGCYDSLPDRINGPINMRGLAPVPEDKNE